MANSHNKGIENAFLIVRREGSVMHNFKAGFGKARMQFNPDEAPIREFETKLDDLYCRVLLISGPDNWALVSFDLTSLRATAIKRYRELVAELLAIAPSKVWVTVTHTFAAPHLPSTTETPAKQASYQLIDRKLVDSLKIGCQLAQEDLQTVEIGQVNANCPLNVNRNTLTEQGWWLGRNFEGYSNHQLRILAFKRADQTVNLVVNYDIQQSVMDHITDDRGRRVISSDLMGNGIQGYEQNDQVAIFIPGCAGDQRPLFTGEAATSFAVVRTLLINQAAIVTESLQRAVQKIQDWQPLQRLWSSQLPVSVPTQVQQHGTFEIKPTKTYKFEPTGQMTTLHLWAVRINQYGTVGTEPELNSMFGESCRRAIAGDATTMIATLVNGAAKYLPEKLDFDRITYQSMNTQLGQTADQRLLDACVRFGRIMREEDARC